MQIRRRSRRCPAWLATLALLLAAGCAEAVNPTTYGAGHRWQLIPQNTVVAGFAFEQERDSRALPVYLAFSKESAERRFLPLQMIDLEEFPDAKALAVKCVCLLAEPRSPHLAVVLFDRQGNGWFKATERSLLPLPAASQPSTARSLPTPDSRPSCIPPEFAAMLGLQSGLLDNLVQEVRFPLRSFRRAAFSQPEEGGLQPSQVNRVWVGLVLDGTARGALKITDVRFTNEPYHPTMPLLVAGLGAGAWSVAQDPAVQSKLSTPNEGPGGSPSMKFEFALPGGRHMYALPNTAVPEAELDGYKALRLTYKASLPKGINSLLVCLWESSGAQYYAVPAPAPREEWTTITIPLSSFKLGEWSRDPDNKLDLDQIMSVVVGLHGTASEPTGSGVIQVGDIAFVP